MLIHSTCHLDQDITQEDIKEVQKTTKSKFRKEFEDSEEKGSDLNSNRINMAQLDENKT